MHGLTYDQSLLVIGVLLAAGVLANKLAVRYGLPSMLLFMGIGMMAGSDGVGGLWFDDTDAAKQIGTVALIFILYSGGLSTHWREVRPHLGPSLALATIGVLVTALVVGAIAHWALGFPLPIAFLLGSILASTDAAAVFSTLRGSGIPLPPKVQAILELESGTNDPTAVFLTVLFVELAMGKPFTVASAFGEFLRDMGLGGLIGFALGRLGAFIVERVRFEFDAMVLVVSVATAMLAYAAPAVIDASGYLGVYVAGVVFGSVHLRDSRTLEQFHDGIAWVMQIVMFLALGLLVFPNQLPGVALGGSLIAFALIFLARPMGVWMGMIYPRETWQTKAVLSWAGLRGAVPIILAAYALIEGVPKGQEVFNLVFFVVVISTLLQGPTIGWLTRRLGVVEPPPADTPAVRG